jgi:hypothetical protein
MKNLKLNKSLKGVNLTRRVVKEQRDRLAKQMAYCSNMLDAHLNRLNKCGDCEKEYEFNLDKTDLDAIKFIYSKTMTDLKDEDLGTAVDEPPSTEEVAKQLASGMSNKGMVKSVIKLHRAEAIQCRDMLIELLTEGDVIEMKDRVTNG